MNLHHPVPEVCASPAAGHIVIPSELRRPRTAGSPRAGSLALAPPSLPFWLVPQHRSMFSGKPLRKSERTHSRARRSVLIIIVLVSFTLKAWQVFEFLLHFCLDSLRVGRFVRQSTSHMQPVAPIQAHELKSITSDPQVPEMYLHVCFFDYRGSLVSLVTFGCGLLRLLARGLSFSMSLLTVAATNAGFPFIVHLFLPAAHTLALTTDITICEVSM